MFSRASRLIAKTAIKRGFSSVAPQVSRSTAPTLRVSSIPAINRRVTSNFSSSIQSKSLKSIKNGTSMAAARITAPVAISAVPAFVYHDVLDDDDYIVYDSGDLLHDIYKKQHIFTRRAAHINSFLHTGYDLVRHLEEKIDEVEAILHVESAAYLDTFQVPEHRARVATLFFVFEQALEELRDRLEHQRDAFKVIAKQYRTFSNDININLLTLDEAGRLEFDAVVTEALDIFPSSRATLLAELATLGADSAFLDEAVIMARATGNVDAVAAWLGRQDLIDQAKHAAVIDGFVSQVQAHEKFRAKELVRQKKEKLAADQAAAAVVAAATAEAEKSAASAAVDQVVPVASEPVAAAQ